MNTYTMMRIYMGKCILALVAGVFACGLVSATPGDTKSYQIRCAATDIVDGHHTLWLRTGAGKKPVKVQLNTRVFSEPVKYKGASVAQFYADKKTAMSKDPAKPIAVVKLSAKSSLIVFWPGKDDSGYAASLIPQSHFPYGSFRVMNLSGDKVRVDMGEKKRVILPARGATYRFAGGNNAVPVSIIMREEETGKARYTRRSKWSIAPTQRELVLLVTNPQNGLVRARHLMDSKVEDE